MRNASAIASGICGLRGDDLGALVLCLGLELLLHRHRECPPLLGLGLGDALVGFRLVGLQLGADVLADVHVGDVDREDLEGGAGVEPLGEDGLGDEIGIFQHLFVGFGRADGADDPLADAGEDRLLARAAHQPVDVGAHRHPREGQELDAVLGHRRHLGGRDHLGIDAHLHRLEDIAAGQVDRRRLLVGERDSRLVGGDEGVDHPLHVAPGEEVTLQVVGAELNPRLVRADQRQHDGPGIDPAKAHAEQGEERHPDTGKEGGQPEPEWDELEEDDQNDDGDEDQRHHHPEAQHRLIHGTIP